MITTVVIAGMRSEHCKRALFTALTPLEGVASAEVWIGGVTIEHDGAATHDAIRAALEPTGFVVASIADERALPVLGSTNTLESPFTDRVMETPR